MEAAWGVLLSERYSYRPSNIIVFGRSLGGAVAAGLAAKYRPRALMLESAFTSAPDLASRFLPLMPMELLIRFKYDTLGYVRNVECPLLVIHSREDELVPFRHGRRIFDEAPPPKEFLEIRGTHNEGFLTSLKSYELGLRSFLSKLKRR